MNRSSTFAIVFATLCVHSPAFMKPLFGDVRHELAKLQPNDAENGGWFGEHVAVRGQRALIGMDFGGALAGSGIGRAYLFDMISGKQLIKLTANDSEHFDFFGHGVALDGNIGLVSAFGDDSDRGSAYVFDLKREASYSSSFRMTLSPMTWLAPRLDSVVTWP